MKVTIKVTVEVDPAEWIEMYGCDRSEVREDVKSYFTNAIQSSAASEFESGLTVRVA